MRARSVSGAPLPIERSGASAGRSRMRAPSRPRSVLRAIAWVYIGPFAVIGGLALCAFGLGVLAIVFQLLAALLKRAGV